MSASYSTVFSRGSDSAAWAGLASPVDETPVVESPVDEPPAEEPPAEEPVAELPVAEDLAPTAP